MTNRLGDSTSPYLIQHAENPVDWYPWGNEPFERAVDEDKPVLVSIGYSACHWCHVMAHESFENPATAQLMNAQFINIKVDREERPDVDAVYMEAVQAMTGQGGWPLNVFLTPKREPFFGGTYFPPAPRHGMPSWPQLLQSIALAWRDERENVRRNAEQLVGHLRETAQPLPPTSAGLDQSILAQAFSTCKDHFDPVHGGFGAAPKFPNAMALSFLLRTWARTGNGEALEMVTTSLDAMARGGIHDHVGEGFHRYTVDGQWLVPHFEKMLYDNALLARLYTETWQATGRELYRKTAEGIFEYVIRDMTAPAGGFYSSEDADSEGEEGKFYVWTAEEVSSVLGADADPFCGRYSVPPEGNFEGKTILTLRSDTADSDQGSDGMLHRLRAARDGRVRPGRDEKVLTDWNALMIDALAYGGTVFARGMYLTAAERCAKFIISNCWRESQDPPRLAHSWHGKASETSGFLADYALLGNACLSLFDATGTPSWLEAATELLSEMVAVFEDGEGGFFTAGKAAARELPVRGRDITDGVVPSGTSAAVVALLRLARHTGDDTWETLALEPLQRLGTALGPHALSFGNALAALDLHLSPRRELVIVYPSEPEPDTEMRQALARVFLPNVLQIDVASRVAAESPIPLLAGRTARDGLVTAYLCARFSCREPIADTALLAQQLALWSPASGRG